MSYLECARQAKATKKFKIVLTSAIRLHPTKADFWLYAARWALESEADMNGARSYMQRGTRFCTRDKDLWIEYAKLEMIYLAKIAMRRKILGLDIDKSIESPALTQGEGGATEDSTVFNTSADIIAIPEFEDNILQQDMIEGVEVDSEAIKDPMTTPALNGAIPLAIFDAARKQPFFCPAAAADFFNMFTRFIHVRCLAKILQHVMDAMTESYPTDAQTCDCYIRQPFVGIQPTSADFPMALGVALDRLKQSLETIKDKAELSRKTKLWIAPILNLDDLDPGIETVLKFTMRKLE